MKVAIKRLTLENFTVFEKIQIPFTPGVNVIIGENGTGKTHVMKVLYSACQAARPDISFSHKLVRVSKWEEQLSSLTSTFIPAKEILSNAWNLEAAVNMNNVDFDDTYVDIVTAAKIDISAGKDSSKRKKLLNILQKITTGTVLFTDEKFYLRSNGKIEFSLVAEGIRKIALLWQLIKNGTLEQGSVLFWDEPEANINPSHVPVLVEMLLELQRNGVQIFISTHDYVFSTVNQPANSSGNPSANQPPAP